MKKFLQLSLVASVALGGVSTSTVVGQSMASDVSSTLERGGASFEVWANQRSNALSSDVLYTFQQGGFLSREFLQTMLETIPCSVAWAVRWDGPIVSAPARWVVDLGR